MADRTGRGGMRGAAGRMLDVCHPSGTWTQATFDISQFAGQTVDDVTIA